MYYVESKVVYLDLNFTELCSLWSDWQYVIIGLSNRLTPNMLQAIPWTYEGWTGSLAHLCTTSPQRVNSLRSRQNGRYNADDIFKCIFLNDNVWFLTKISLKFVPKGPINNIQALVLIMAWRRPGDKPLSEPITVSLLTHICVTRPQWAKIYKRLLYKLRSVQNTGTCYPGQGWFVRNLGWGR